MIPFVLDMDVSLPDEILRHCGSLCPGRQQSGRGGEDREESVGLQSSDGSFWYDNKLYVFSLPSQKYSYVALS